MQWCYACGGDVSDVALYCRHCSAPQDEKSKRSGRRQAPEMAPPAPPPTSTVVQPPAPVQQPPPVEPPPYVPVPTMQRRATRTNAIAVASFVLGVLWLAGLGSVFAIVLGFIGRNQIDREPAAQRGRSAAIAGIVLGFVGIGVLIVLLMAIPTFQLERTRDRDRAAQASLRDALAAAKTAYTDNETYAGATPDALREVNRSLVFVGGRLASDDPRTVSVVAQSRSAFVAAALSESGTCWYLRDDVAEDAELPGTWWNSSDHGTCRATDVPAEAWSRTPPVAD